MTITSARLASALTAALERRPPVGRLNFADTGTPEGVTARRATLQRIASIVQDVVRRLGALDDAGVRGQALDMALLNFPDFQPTPAERQGIIAGSVEVAQDDELEARMSEIAAAERLDPRKPSDRSRIAALTAKRHPEALPKYGNRDPLAQMLGGEERAERLRGVAREHGLRLNNPSELAYSVRVLCREESTHVATARSISEGIQAVMLDGGWGQREDRQREAALILAEQRPDLLPQYGSGEKPLIAGVVEFAETAELDAEERARKFSEAVDERLRKLDLPDTAGNRGAAARHVAATRPELVGRYGSGGDR